MSRRCRVTLSPLPLLLLLAALLAPPRGAHAAVDTSTCVGGDCCWSGNRERYCACTAAVQTRPVERNPCALVRCAAGPPADACDAAGAPPAGAATPAAAANERPSRVGLMLGGVAGQRCACPKIFRPVCAGGRQFSNACMAGCANATSFAEGPCAAPQPAAAPAPP